MDDYTGWYTLSEGDNYTYFIKSLSMWGTARITLVKSDTLEGFGDGDGDGLGDGTGMGAEDFGGDGLGGSITEFREDL